MRKFSCPAPEPFSGRKVHFALFDSPREVAQEKVGNRRRNPSWCGGHSLQEAQRVARGGDLTSVPESDRLLSKMEEFQLHSSRKVWLNDVAGAFPDISTFLSGSPLGMKRREIQESTSAPLAIIIDLTTSASLNAFQTRARGCAILALVRTLSEARTTELWVVSGLDAFGRDACFVGCRIETLPLDLATAAHCLTHVGFPRHLLYGIAHREFDFDGGWPFKYGTLTRDQMEQCLAPAFTHVQETLCLPGIHLSDPSVLDPEGWLRRELLEHDPRKLEEVE